MSVDRVKPDDSGTYRCMATNRIGSCCTLGELNVQGAAETRILINHWLRYHVDIFRCAKKAHNFF